MALTAADLSTLYTPQTELHKGAPTQPQHAISCFYCCDSLTFGELEEWADGGTTPICPRCHIDAIITGAVAVADLQQMHRAAFGSIEDYFTASGEPQTTIQRAL